MGVLSIKKLQKLDLDTLKDKEFPTKKFPSNKNVGWFMRPVESQKMYANTLREQRSILSAVADVILKC